MWYFKKPSWNYLSIIVKGESFTLAPLDIFEVALGEVGGVVNIVGVGPIPPERLEILLEFWGFEHTATVGIG